MGPAPEDNRVSADEALARLIEGNRRFLRGEARGAAFRRETLADLAQAQRPMRPSSVAATRGCRPNGSSIPAWENCSWCAWPATSSPRRSRGRLQYAGSHLQTPLFVVLGHEGCGAIAAALAAKHEGEQFRSRVQRSWRASSPASRSSSRHCPPRKVVAGRREQRAVDGPPDPGFAGRAGRGGGRTDEDRRRGVRARDRPGPAPAPGRADMTPWPVRQTFDLVVVGKRLGVLLLAVAAYCSAAGLLVRTFELRVIESGECGDPDQHPHPEPPAELPQPGGLRPLVVGPRAVGPADQRHPQPGRQVRRLPAGRRPGPFAGRRDARGLRRGPEASPARRAAAAAGAAGVRARGGRPAARAAVSRGAALRRRRRVEA